MADFTSKEYERELDRRLKEISFANETVFGIIAEAHSQLLNRLFIKGKRPSGRKIGTYSQGYAARRRKAGRQSNFVDLMFSNRLRQDFANSLTIDRKDVVSGVYNKENGEKVGHLRELYEPQLFNHSKREVRYIQTEMQKEMSKIMNGGR